MKSEVVCFFRAKIVILSLPGVSLGTAPCLVLEYLVDVSVFYRTIGGLGIAIFRQNIAHKQWVEKKKK